LAAKARYDPTGLFRANHPLDRTVEVGTR
jgi:hypothetical protein